MHIYLAISPIFHTRFCVLWLVLTHWGLPTMLYLTSLLICDFPWPSCFYRTSFFHDYKFMSLFACIFSTVVFLLGILPLVRSMYCNYSSLTIQFSLRYSRLLCYELIWFHTYYVFNICLLITIFIYVYKIGPWFVKNRQCQIKNSISS